MTTTQSPATDQDRAQLQAERAQLEHERQALARERAALEREKNELVFERMVKGLPLNMEWQQRHQQLDLSAVGALRADHLHQIVTHQELGTKPHLNLSEQPRFDDKLLTTLLEHPESSLIRSLDLRGTGVSDAGIRQLAASPHMAGLERLELGDGKDMGPHLSFKGKTTELADAYIQASPHLTIVREQRQDQGLAPVSIERASLPREQLDTGARLDAPARPSLEAIALEASGTSTRAQQHASGSPSEQQHGQEDMRARAAHIDAPHREQTGHTSLTHSGGADKPHLEPLPERFKMSAIKSQLMAIEREPSDEARIERFGHLVEQLAKPAYEAQSERWADSTARALDKLMMKSEREAPDSMLALMAKEQQLPASASLVRHIELDNRGPYDSQDLSKIAAHEGMASITGLNVTDRPNFDDRALQALIDNPHATNLQSLSLEGSGVSDVGIKALASSPHMTQMNALSLGAGELYDGKTTFKSVEYLHASPHIPNHAVLDIERSSDAVLRSTPPSCRSLDAQAFVQVRAELTGERFSTPKPNLTHEGVVNPELIKLKEGDFMAIDKGQNRLQLVPASPELAAHAGQPVKLMRDGAVHAQSPEREAPALAR